jgi:DNA-binding NarL/FixJ family response regulator
LVAGDGLISESAEPRAIAVVGLVAGDPELRRRVAGALDAAGLEVGLEAEDTPSLLDELEGVAPAAVVLASDPGTRIASQIRSLRQRLRSVPVIALIPATNETQSRRAISAGADGAVLEGDLDAALAVTVLAAVVGQISFPQASQRLGEEPALTRREGEVLADAALGFTNAQIADRLGLAESTVKSHLSSAFAKLGVESRAEAAALIRDPARGRRRGPTIEPDASE